MELFLIMLWNNHFEQSLCVFRSEHGKTFYRFYLAVMAKHLFHRASFEGRLIRLLPAASALVIVAAGLAMTVRALPKVS